MKTNIESILIHHCIVKVSDICHQILLPPETSRIKTKEIPLLFLFKELCENN